MPSGITGVEQRAVEEGDDFAAGARRAYIIEEPMAAAIGAGLPIHEPAGNMVVDIGGGTTEAAVISLGGIAHRPRPDRRRRARRGDHQPREEGVPPLLGERTAEAIKLAIAAVYPTNEELVAEIPGRDLVSGLPKTLQITDGEIRAAIEEPVSAIIDSIKATLDRTPTGARRRHHAPGHHAHRRGALLRGIDKRLRHETGTPVHIADNPLSSVAIGSESASRNSRSSSGSW